MAAIKPITTWRRTTAWCTIFCGTVAPSGLFPTLIRTAILSRNSFPTWGRRRIAAVLVLGCNLSSSDKRSSHCNGKVVAFPFAHRRWRFINASWAKLRSDRYRHSMLKHVNAVKHGLALKTSKTVHCSAYRSRGGYPSNISFVSASAGFCPWRYKASQHATQTGTRQCAHIRLAGQRCGPSHTLSSGQASKVTANPGQATWQVHVPSSSRKAARVFAPRESTYCSPYLWNPSSASSLSGCCWSTRCRST